MLLHNWAVEHDLADPQTSNFPRAPCSLVFFFHYNFIHEFVPVTLTPAVMVDNLAENADECPLYWCII